MGAVAAPPLTVTGCAARWPPRPDALARPLTVPPALRYLLKFGEVTPYLGYNALRDFFPSMPMRPNPTCTNAHCVRQQAAFAAAQAQRPIVPAAVPAAPVAVVHEDNSWGMLPEPGHGGACRADRHRGGGPNVWGDVATRGQASWLRARRLGQRTRPRLPPPPVRTCPRGSCTPSTRPPMPTWYASIGMARAGRRPPWLAPHDGVACADAVATLVQDTAEVPAMDLEALRRQLQSM